jgi:hypothetical protein
MELPVVKRMFVTPVSPNLAHVTFFVFATTHTGPQRR